MRYSTGEIVRLGDQVILGERVRAPGIVVADIDGGEYGPEHPEVAWSSLERGAVIEFKGYYGLIHYIEPDEDFVLVARASGLDDAAST